MKDLMEALNRAHELDEHFDDFEEQGSDFYHRAEKELEKHFNCTGAYLEPSTQNGMGRTFLFADDMCFDGSFDFETGEDYIYEDDFDGFLTLCKNSFKPCVDESFANGNAEGGFLDTAKRPGGSTKGSGTNHKALDGKKTKIVKAKDLKPGMITDTGKILKVTNVGWVNGKPSVEVSYGGIGNRGSYASDTVAADRDYQVLDEALVTDHMDSETLHRAMQHPMFGTFNAYNQEESMIVKTTTNHGAFGGVNQSHRYFKFVRGEDGWEAYEVSSTGDKVGDTFLIDNI